MKKSIVASVCVLAAAVTALAVKPVTWTHSTEAEFASGKLSKAVVTSLGEVKLSRSLNTLVKPAKKNGIISAMAIDKRGEVYLAAAPKATVYRIEGDKLVKFAQLPGVLIRSMVFVGDKLVAGTCGKEAGIYRIDRKGEVKKIWTDKKVVSVWSVIPGPGGSFYAATGAEGKIYHVESDGKADVIYDSDEKNILSLTAGAKGILYAGTGENGLVIEVDAKQKKGRILYDAKEAEISCLIVVPDGTLYAATSDSSKATDNGEAPSNDVKGKPDKTTPTKPAGKITTKPATKPAGKTPVTTTPAKQTDKKSSELELLKKSLVKPDSGKSEGPMNKINTQAGWAKLIRGKDGKFRVVGAGGTTTKKPAPAPRQVPPEIMRRMMTARRSSSAERSTPSRPTSGKGNAVYRIDKAGFVQAVFRRPVTILAMVMHEGALVLGTGHGGQVFTVGTDGEQICAIAKLDPKDITALVADSKGGLYMGTAGAGGLFKLGKGFAKKGTCISKVFDAGQIARWGTMNIRADVPAGCGVTVATRSGNVTKPDEKTWSDWSIETIVGAGWLPIACPAGRFIQYRLTLAGEGKATPSVDKVALVHQVGNLAPVVSAVKVAASSKPSPDKNSTSPMRFRIIQAKASDPNGDTLQYAVFFRRVGRKKWIKLVEKSSKPVYAWDTLAVPNGNYEVRVKVTDVPGNAPSAALTAARISRPILVDNSPPKATGLLVKDLGKGEVSFSGRASDVFSRIRRIDYAVDSNKEWVRLLPADGICDSQQETFSTTISDLEAGTHRIAVRATDQYNNAGYASVEITVGK